MKKPRLRPVSSPPKKVGIYKVLVDGIKEGALYWRGEPLGWSLFPFPMTVTLNPEKDFWYSESLKEYSPVSNPKLDPNDPFNQEALM